MPIPKVTAPRYTVDEIESWPDDGNRYELLDGSLLVTPMPDPPHQLVVGALAAELSQLLRPWPAILVVAPGVIIQRPHTELIPDVLVFERPRGGEFEWEDVTRHLLAVEVMSTPTRIYDRDFKRLAYLALGVAESWRVDWEERVVLVSRPGEPPDQPRRGVIEWEPAGLGVTLSVRLDEVFRDIDP